MLLLTVAEPKPDPVLALFVVFFYFYLAWLLFTSGGAK
jgi:hypothetical protein